MALSASIGEELDVWPLSPWVTLCLNFLQEWKTGGSGCGKEDAPCEPKQIPTRLTFEEDVVSSMLEKLALLAASLHRH